MKSLEKIEDINEEYKESAERIKSIYYDLEDCGRNISNFAQDIYFDDREIDEVESRLNLISSMKRKYGNDVQEILKYKEDVEKEIYEIENLEEDDNITNAKEDVLSEINEYIDKENKEVHDEI